MFEKEAKVMIWLILGFPIFGGMLALYLPRFGIYGFVASATMVCGGYLVIKSKLAQKKRTKVLVEWGTAAMLAEEKKNYLLGYSLIGLSFLIATAVRLFGL